MSGEHCTSACKTRDHATWGECVRDKGIRVAWAQEHKGRDLTIQKKADKNLDEYAKARSYGIQPKSTRPADVQHAVRVSDETGTAYKAE